MVYLMLCGNKKVLQDGEQSAVYPADRNPMSVIRTSREGTLCRGSKYSHLLHSCSNFLRVYLDIINSDTMRMWPNKSQNESNTENGCTAPYSL